MGNKLMVLLSQHKHPNYGPSPSKHGLSMFYLLNIIQAKQNNIFV